MIAVHLGDGDVYVPKFDAEKGALRLEADGDDPIDLDDNPYLHEQ